MMAMRAYPRLDGGGIISLRTVLCRACNHIIADVAPGSLVRVQCQNRHCGRYSVVEVTKAGLIRTRLESQDES